MAKKTGAQLVAYAKSMLGHPYWFGTYGQKPTLAMLETKTRQYPAHYSASRRAGYIRDIQAGKRVTDCSGLIKGCVWMNAAGNISYQTNGVGDQNANGMYAAAKIKGAIKRIPEIPGLAVYRPGHIGVYIGAGEVIEARGRDWGVVKTKLKERDFTHWLRLGFIDYSEPAPIASSFLLLTIGSVHLRTGPSTDYQSVGILPKMELLTALTGDDGKRLSVGGWWAVVTKDGVRWVSGKYAV